MSDFIDSFWKELLARTNAQAHPTLVGNKNPFSARVIIFLTVLYTFWTMLSYKNGIDDHRDLSLVRTRGDHMFLYHPGNAHLAELAERTHQAFQRLAELLGVEIDGLTEDVPPRNWKGTSSADLEDTRNRG